MSSIREYNEEISHFNGLKKTKNNSIKKILKKKHKNLGGNLKGNWSQREDEKLLRLVRIKGAKNWSEIA